MSETTENFWNKEKEMEMLRNSYDMYDRSIQEMKEKRKNLKDANGNRVYTDDSIEDTEELMNTMLQDIVTKYIELGGSEKELKDNKKRKKKFDFNNTKERLTNAIKSINSKDAMRNYLNKLKDSDSKYENNEENNNEEEVVKKETPLNGQNGVKYEEKPITPTTSMVNGIKVVKTQNKQQYDTIPLPSKGECYPNHLNEISVAYLTTYDENLILSPNLYKKGTFLDHILKNKVLTDIDPDDLVQGDRDAIIIWLRASGYGSEYPVTLKDDKTGERYDSVIDLSTLNYKPFTLKGDENGYFTYIVPSTGDEIKFKFLTNKDNKELYKMRYDESNQIKCTEMKEHLDSLIELIEDNDIITTSQEIKIRDAVKTLNEEIIDKLSEVNDEYISHELTNRLIKSTISINGNTDRNYIAEYIVSMDIKEGGAYRKYIIDNEPGIDYTIKVQRPDSLGGGYQETFLQLDQFIFVNTL